MLWLKWLLLTKILGEIFFKERIFTPHDDTVAEKKEETSLIKKVQYKFGSQSEYSTTKSSYIQWITIRVLNSITRLDYAWVNRRKITKAVFFTTDHFPTSRLASHCRPSIIENSSPFAKAIANPSWYQISNVNNRKEQFTPKIIVYGLYINAHVSFLVYVVCSFK